MICGSIRRFCRNFSAVAVTLDVRNGKEAVGRRQRRKISARSGSRMPEKNGDEAAKEIRQFCDIPMVLMTADITAEFKASEWQTGIYGVSGQADRCVRAKESD